MQAHGNISKHHSVFDKGCEPFLFTPVLMSFVLLNLQFAVYCIVYHCLSFCLFFIWLLYCLSIDLRLVITPQVTSNCSYSQSLFLTSTTRSAMEPRLHFPFISQEILKSQQYSKTSQWLANMMCVTSLTVVCSKFIAIEILSQIRSMQNGLMNYVFPI